MPSEYAERVAKRCRETVICRVPQGEEHKSIETWKMLLETMLYHSFGRKDCVAAVGGGCYGKSITDPCLGWEKSERLTLELAEMI